MQLFNVCTREQDVLAYLDSLPGFEDSSADRADSDATTGADVFPSQSVRQIAEHAKQVHDIVLQSAT